MPCLTDFQIVLPNEVPMTACYCTVVALGSVWSLEFRMFCILFFILFSNSQVRFSLEEAQLDSNHSIEVGSAAGFMLVSGGIMALPQLAVGKFLLDRKLATNQRFVSQVVG